MLTIAVKGSYPKYPAPPRPSLVSRAIHTWRIGRLSDEDMEKSLRRGEVENVAEMVYAGCDTVWDGQLRWDSPAWLLRWLKGVEDWPNQFIGEKIEHDHEGDDSVERQQDQERLSGNGHSINNREQPTAKFVGKVEWQRPILIDTYRFLLERVPVELRPVITGPVTLAQLGKDDYYTGRNRDLIHDIARALNREIEGLESAGANQILIEEPLFLAGDLSASEAGSIYSKLSANLTCDLFLAASNEITTNFQYVKNMPFKGFAIDALRLDPLSIPELLDLFEHLGSVIELGVIDSRRPTVERPEDLAELLTKWGRIYPPDRLWVSSTTGLGGLTKEIAFEKLQALAKGVGLAIRELAKDE